MTATDEIGPRLTQWLQTKLPDADEVRIEGLDRVTFGHSAEMMVLTVVARHGDAEERQDVVLRLRPRPPALLEPYDLERQFDILRGLANTNVRAPRALWLEDSGEVLGRPFLIMNRVAGQRLRDGSADRCDAPTHPTDVRKHGRAACRDPFGGSFDDRPGRAGRWKNSPRS